MFLSCLLQKPVDSDEIWYTHSWLFFSLYSVPMTGLAGSP